MVTAGIVLALLYVGRDVLVPLALAIMLSFLMAPVVRALRRIGVGHTPSVLMAVLTLTVSCMAVAMVLGIQTLRLAESLPQYEATVQRKLKTLDEVTVGRFRLLTREASRLLEIHHDAAEPIPGSAGDLERPVLDAPAGCGGIAVTRGHAAAAAAHSEAAELRLDPAPSHGDRAARPHFRAARA